MSNNWILHWISFW